MASSFAHICATALLLSIAPAVAFAAEDSNTWLAVDFQKDSPVVASSINLERTTATNRGANMLLDLRASLKLRNIGTKPICGLTLRVEAQDISPYGKGSVVKPSMFIAPGEEFPVRVDMQLLRPLASTKKERALVLVTLDCALFNDLKSYGPDKLNSRRTLIVYELQAKRDRQYLSSLIDQGRLPELRNELNRYLPDQVRSLGLELLDNPFNRPTHEQAISVQTVVFPAGPVQPLRGAAQVSGSEVRAPRVEVRNSSKHAVSSIGMGWIVRDDQGKSFSAGAVTSPLNIPPIQNSAVTETGTLRFSRVGGQPMNINGLMAFINDVEFADGNLWIPSRADIDQATPDATLRNALAASPEEQRLAQLWRREGTEALKKELKKY